MSTTECHAAEDLSAYEPKTDAEARDAAIAVVRAREAASDAAGVDALTVFERALVNAAYAAGVAETAKAVSDAIGPAAVTLDSTVIRAAVTVPYRALVDDRPPDPSLDAHEQFVRGQRRVQPAVDVGQLVRGARERADRYEQAPAEGCWG